MIRVRPTSRGWWLVDLGGIIAKFKSEFDAVEYAAAKARPESGIVYVVGKDGRINKRIQT